MLGRERNRYRNDKIAGVFHPTVLYDYEIWVLNEKNEERSFKWESMMIGGRKIRRLIL